MEASLKQRTISGSFWSFADNILGQGITFVVGLALARLLTPNDYGIIGIVIIFVAISNSIVDSGFSNALIRKNDAKDIDYNTVFITNVIVSVIIFVLIFFTAPYISQFFPKYDASVLTLILQVTGVIIIINSFSLIQKTILTKRIDFKTQTKVSLISSVISGIVGLTMAFFNFGVWSLSGQIISRQLLYCFFLWIFNSWRPKFIFSKNSFRELFGFGWKLLVSGLIDTIWREIYSVVIGRYYSGAILGQFTKAKEFSTISSSNLTAVVQRVSYPALSEIKDDKLKLKLAYKKVIKITMFVTFCCMLGTAAIAKSMILVLIGDQWIIAIGFLQVLCLQMMLYPLHAINLNMLQIQGRSDLFLYLEIIKKIVAVVPVVLGIFIDIYWMLWGSVVVGLISYYINSYYSGKLISYGVKEQVNDILPSFLLSSFMGVIVYLLSYINLSPYIMLPLQIIVGAIIFIGLAIIFKMEEYIDLKNIVLSLLKKFKHAK